MIHDCLAVRRQSVFQENTLQRILERGEIESLDHTKIPRLRLPEGGTVFAERAARLRQLSAGHAAAAYLQLMAQIADIQHRLLPDCPAPTLDPEALQLAQAHGMPPLQAIGRERDPSWRHVLQALLDQLAGLDTLTPQTRSVMTQLQTLRTQSPDDLESLADAILAERDADIDCQQAPFIMAALQVYWTAQASRLDPVQVPHGTPFGTCPVCGSLPVASIQRVGGTRDGLRFLCCSLCATEWHVVRVTCTHCENNKSILYHSIEGGPEAIQAESCDECHSYRKLFNQEKDLEVEPVADDLASIPLDVLMGEAGYSRASGNPLLWQGAAATSE
ncbi:formate dehydrogenase accessory protein FdhE [Castellaniella caeni]